MAEMSETHRRRLYYYWWTSEFKIWRLQLLFHASEILRENLFMQNTDGSIRPDSTPAKSCLCEIRMVGHDWFFSILSLFSLSQWVELTSTHERSEIVSRVEWIQWNYSCATICISHKQVLAKNFAGVESALYEKFHWIYSMRGKISLRQWLEISSTHCESERGRIQ